MNFHNQQQGNSYGRGGFRGGRGGGRQQGGRTHHPKPTTGMQAEGGQRPPVELCKFYTKGIQCNNGNNCRQDVSSERWSHKIRRWKDLDASLHQ